MEASALKQEESSSLKSMNNKWLKYTIPGLIIVVIASLLLVLYLVYRASNNNSANTVQTQSSSSVSSQETSPSSLASSSTISSEYIIPEGYKIDKTLIEGQNVCLLLDSTLDFKVSNPHGVYLSYKAGTLPALDSTYVHQKPEFSISTYANPQKVNIQEWLNERASSEAPQDAQYTYVEDKTKLTIAGSESIIFKHDVFGPKAISIVLPVSKEIVLELSYFYHDEELMKEVFLDAVSSLTFDCKGTVSINQMLKESVAQTISKF